MEALIIFILLLFVWITILTYRERKGKRKNKIIEKKLEYYIEINRLLKLKLNPTSDGKEDREKEETFEEEKDFDNSK